MVEVILMFASKRFKILFVLLVVVILGTFLVFRKFHSAQSSASVTTFTVAQLQKYREPVAKYRFLSRVIPPEEYRWFTPLRDPNAYLLAFPNIRLQSPYFLFAASWEGDTRHALGTSGFTKVYATCFNVGSTAPDPPTRPARNVIKNPDWSAMIHPSPEKPFKFLGEKEEDLLQFIEGDYSPESYMQAVIFKYEVQDFQSYWQEQWQGKYNAMSWNAHMFLDAAPEYYDFPDFDPPKKRGNRFFGLMNRSNPLPSTWKWLQSRPSTWAPSVVITSNQVTVEFFTFTNHSKRAIFHHRVTFSRNSYKPTSWAMSQILDAGEGWLCM